MLDEQAYLERLSQSKDERRKRLAALAVHEKVKIMIEMQKAVAPILRQRGKKVRVWDE